ncbi:DUF4249 domain-containing protein [Hymenobacter sp. BT730]|uniref:DUF4249 domain-containing protein n=1 Tax=Hymenobacter sp. BT730 TaxID=3063332 RepID=UPI0026E070AB|nr:DUF4249 domain-containing protein [Hymenobacter sp. BT730]
MCVWKKLFCWVLLPLLASCVTPFEPEVLNEPVTILVVNGYINSGGVTTITLSRTRNLAVQEPYQPETQASLAIEDDAGTRWPLQEGAPGTYVSESLQLPAGQQYHLRIQTQSGRRYASEFVPLKPAPPIDSLSGRIEADGLQFYLSAHDDVGRTQYYRWEYAETWEFTSGAWSRLEKQIGDTLLPRTDDIYHCWRTENSTAVYTATTVPLSRDAVLDYRLLLIPPTSSRLRFKYSLLVRQFALTEAEFQYWEALKKNSQNIGGLFDPLPSQLTGNVHSETNTTEPVLGYVGAGTVAEKRIFIDNNSLPPTWSLRNEGYEGCMLLDTIFKKDASFNLALFFSDPNLRLPVGPVTDRAGNLLGYTYQTTACVDCRLRGTNSKPSFWP